MTALVWAAEIVGYVLVGAATALVLDRIDGGGRRSTPMELGTVALMWPIVLPIALAAGAAWCIGKVLGGVSR